MRDWALMLAFIDVESAFQRNAFLMDRNGGSIGLAQIDLATAQWAGYKGTAEGLKDPRTNITWLCRIIDKLTNGLTVHGVYSLANLAAAYNTGLQHVLDGGIDRAYEAKILSAYVFYQNLERKP